MEKKIIGVDSGSVSASMVILNEDQSIDLMDYVFHKGKP